MKIGTFMNREWVHEFNDQVNPMDDKDLTREEKFKLGFYSTPFFIRHLSDKLKLKIKQLTFLQSLIEQSDTTSIWKIKMYDRDV
jgi:hypothetical protein